MKPELKVASQQFFFFIKVYAHSSKKMWGTFMCASVCLSTPELQNFAQYTQQTIFIMNLHVAQITKKQKQDLILKTLTRS